jgi:hypothetical protein
VHVLSWSRNSISLRLTLSSDESTHGSSPCCCWERMSCAVAAHSLPHTRSPASDQPAAAAASLSASLLFAVCVSECVLWRRRRSIRSLLLHPDGSSDQSRISSHSLRHHPPATSRKLRREIPEEKDTASCKSENSFYFTCVTDVLCCLLTCDCVFPPEPNPLSPSLLYLLRSPLPACLAEKKRVHHHLAFQAKGFACCERKHFHASSYFDPSTREWGGHILSRTLSRTVASGIRRQRKELLKQHQLRETR